MNHNIDAVGGFAAAVRSRLGDLPPADVEDLTEGLEADLTERLAEDGLELGDPAAYAEELRVSAGLGSGKGAVAHTARRRSASEFFADELVQFRSHPAGSSIVDFLVAVRPAWWLLRGWVAFTLLLQLLAGEFLVLPRTFFEFLAWAALLVASVQWGRGRWQSGPIGRKFLLGTSTLMALLALPFMGGWAAMILDSSRVPAYASDAETAQGLVLDGSGVSNIFPYDCSGKPMGNVQLYDQEGRKIAVGTQDEDYIVDFETNLDTNRYLLPNQFLSTTDGWNIFPLDTVPNDPGLDITEQLGAPVRVAAPAPFPSVQPLLDGCKAPVPEAGENADQDGKAEAGAAAPTGASATPGNPGQRPEGSPSPSSGN